MIVIRIGEHGDLYFCGIQTKGNFEIHKVFYTYVKALQYMRKQRDGGV